MTHVTHVPLEVPHGWHRGEPLNVIGIFGESPISKNARLREDTYWRRGDSVSLKISRPTWNIKDGRTIFCLVFYSVEEINKWLDWWWGAQDADSLSTDFFTTG
jgi:hypothetical protein